MPKTKILLALKHSDVEFSPRMNVKMANIIDILPLMSRINFTVVWVENVNKFYNFEVWFWAVWSYET